LLHQIAVACGTHIESLLPANQDLQVAVHQSGAQRYRQPELEVTISAIEEIFTRGNPTVIRLLREFIENCRTVANAPEPGPSWEKKEGKGGRGRDGI
jgi:hypothetical protein